MAAQTPDLAQPANFPIAQSPIYAAPAIHGLLVRLNLPRQCDPRAVSLNLPTD